MKYENLARLHIGEESLRLRALTLIGEDSSLDLHVKIIQTTMDFSDLLRMIETNHEDLKVIQLFSIRIFNAFATSFKLALAGYGQNSALVMRDIMETVFLLDMFQSKPEIITTWRLADEKRRKAEFGPIHVRKFLDDRDGLTSMKRAERYKLFSELASHPPMKSQYMLRPDRDGDSVVGPFISKSSLEAVISEMGRLAMEACECLVVFFPEPWLRTSGEFAKYQELHKQWFSTFYPK